MKKKLVVDGLFALVTVNNNNTFSNFDRQIKIEKINKKKIRNLNNFVAQISFHLHQMQTFQ